MISFLISVLPPEPRGITDAAEASSLKQTCIADDRADASEDVLLRHARSANVPPRLPSLGRMTALASRAGHLAQALLQEPLPRRWEFDPAPYALASVLTCCDMTISPDGELVPVEQRLAEIQDRYGPGHLVSRSISAPRR